MLRAQEKYDEANVEFRETIRISPSFAEAHCEIGLVLSIRGHFREALESLEKGHELGSKHPRWLPIGKVGSRRSRARGVGREAPRNLGRESHSQGRERTTRVGRRLLQEERRYAAAVRFFEDAFADRPAQIDDLLAGRRFDAACAASSASVGAGSNDPLPDEAARIEFRKKALGWLRADLAAWTMFLDHGNGSGRGPAAVRGLELWKQDSELADIRDEPAMLNLPTTEREAFRSLWSELDRLLAKARAASLIRVRVQWRRDSGYYCLPITYFELYNIA